jgi:hypothetical protein
MVTWEATALPLGDTRLLNYSFEKDYLTLVA